MKTIDIYTDGSHLDKLNNGRLGCGGIMVLRENQGYGKKLDEFSQELEPDYMKEHYGSSTCSNPTAEMLGLLCALRNFNIPRDAEVVVYADYIGVKSWMEGKWKVKEPYLKKVKAEIDEEIKKQNLRGRISFEWVKAHQTSLNKDAYWNNKVDLLAKGL